MQETGSFLDVPVGQRQIQAYYAQAAPVYDERTAEYEAIPKALALEVIARKPGEAYLEVAVGTGASLAEQARRSGPDGLMGVDLTPAMLRTAAANLAAAGAPSVPLLLGDARHLPLPDGSFDCLFNSYMLDLIPTADLPRVVGEFRRVLRPGGRLVLVGLTEAEGGEEDEAFIQQWKERYTADAISCGGCRPLRVAGWLADAGFLEIERTYCGEGKSWPSEVVSARTPAA